MENNFGLSARNRKYILTSFAEVSTNEISQRAEPFSAAAGKAICFRLIEAGQDSGFVVPWATLKSLGSSEASGLRLAQPGPNDISGIKSPAGGQSKLLNKDYN